MLWTNTGEGSASPYHLKHGGDIVWQIGTGLFGYRDKEDLYVAPAYKRSVNAIPIPKRCCL